MKQRLIAALHAEKEMEQGIATKMAELAELDEKVADAKRRLEDLSKERADDEREVITTAPVGFHPQLVNPTVLRRKTLILGFDGLLVSIKKTVKEYSSVQSRGWEILQVKKTLGVVLKSGLKDFLEHCVREFHLIIWTSRARTTMDAITEFLFKSDRIPSAIFHQQGCTIWTRSECTVLKTGVSDTVALKDFALLHKHNLSRRDVLMIESSVQRMSTNNPFNGLYPRHWDPEHEGPTHTFLMPPELDGGLARAAIVVMALLEPPRLDGGLARAATIIAALVGPPFGTCVSSAALYKAAEPLVVLLGPPKNRALDNLDGAQTFCT
ncbi:hypothetical protein R1sor_010051 [Riccia sorocarpa]|uniref:Mitochondrial import inner membrane translocase subunit TIM50 n=1 Tax=Riccia sorocarpa TaxID=122646 RepID=A0ABD3I0V0_9MARC